MSIVAAWVTPGLEAIDHQEQRKLFHRLTECINKLRTSGELTTEAFIREGFVKAIEEETGMSLRFKLLDSPEANAAVLVPDLDRNSPMLIAFEQQWRENDDLHALAKLTHGKVEGWLDRKNSKLGGVFSRMLFTSYLTTGLLQDTRYTDGEVASVMLHELGHVYSYLERLIDVVSSNFAITSVSQRILQLDDPIMRLKLIHEFESYEGVKLPDAEVIANTTDATVLYTRLITESIKRRRNAEGDLIYSMRGFEFSADQFAIRHGSGFSSVSAWDKMNRFSYSKESAYTCWAMHLFGQIRAVIGTIAAIVGSVMFPPALLIVIPMLLATLMSRPDLKRYDDPAQRLRRMRNELVDALKNTNVPDAVRKARLEDVLAADEIIGDLVDKRGFVEALWAYVVPSGKTARMSMEYQQSIERLAHNNLFVASAKFQQLASEL